MQTIILAAGRGSRLGPLTRDLPKALIEVGSKTLLQHALRFACDAGANRRIVVGGHRFEQVAAHLRQVDSEALLAHNPDVLRGNLLSLLAGLPMLEDGGFLLMNTDHIYPTAMARIVSRVSSTADQVVAFCDFDRELGADDMKVRLRGRQVSDMSKTLPRWDAGYVGMTYVPAPSRAVYAAAVACVREDFGDDSSVEQVLVSLARQGHAPVLEDVSGFGWHEVDEAHERDRAERALRGSLY